ncbi:FAD/NAD(P)-binding domain-containing protein [Leucogyrophana mollusca]|uniref:FAD/NAD(P)-binding domain-containing protein n=1 Tax=Leucogyrophana mollusca TaxID=85980 RepID=A0ACB8BKM7_9AGAM|nr:FAD/NAD(P)-binding domain-containing protein [Leucogyrophana mollusca]
MATPRARHERGHDLIQTLTGPLQSALLILFSPIFAFLRIAYFLAQYAIVLAFKPKPPPNETKRPYARIAVIGAGLTGVSSAAHAIAHGFEVIIYEATDHPGGIWSRENKTSGLQLNSLLYRFHPGVIWKEAFPKRDEILTQISGIWKEYKLESRTRLNTPVTKVKRLQRECQDGDKDGTSLTSSASSFSLTERAAAPAVLSPSQWVINDGEDGLFDALIVTVGTCGDPMWIKFEGMPDDETDELSPVRAKQPGSPSHGADSDTFSGPILHSSQLDSATPELLRGKVVAVIGSGASGVEAVETALQRGAEKCIMFAREDKWIIPRNVIFDTALAAQPFGRETPLSFVWERFLRLWQYHGITDLVPNKGIFAGTPVVNDEFLDHVRSGKCTYVRGDTQRLTRHGAREKEENMEKKNPQDELRVEDINADVVVLATGYKRPDLSFLPQELFPEGYDRPNMYLQNFSTEDWSLLMTNSAYLNAIGTVGHVHIGIYTRILLTLLLDPDARPAPKDMKLWVDVVRYIKRGASGGALGFFTYMELTIWILTFHLFRPDRLRWMPFIMQGWGVHPDDERLGVV